MSGSAALDELLARHHVGLTGSEVLQELDAAFAALPGAGAAPLSTPEIQFLRDHAGGDAAAQIDSWTGEDERDERARTAVRQLTGTLANSVDMREAAAILGVDRSRVSRRLTNKSLWALTINRRQRVPRWQFVGHELLPGLDVIVRAIPTTANPASVASFMHTPQPDFAGHTPIEHLTAGGDPALVAAFLDSLDRW